MKRLAMLCVLSAPMALWAQAKPAAPAAKEATAKDKDAGKKVMSGDPKPAPGMNWETQRLKATGVGAPDLKASSPAQARIGAEKAAQLDAFRNLLAQAKGVQITAAKRMGELMEKDEIRARVEGSIRNFNVSGKRYFSDGSVEVDVEVPASVFTEVVDPDPTPVAPAKVEGEKTNTGLVIDARGLNLTPALTPRVLDDGGKSLYSIDSLSADARRQSGVAAYVQNLEDAKKSQKAGDRPLMVKAKRVDGSDVVLDPDDAKKLASVNASFLTDGKVVIVMN